MKVYTLVEAAGILGRSPSTLRHQAQRGKLRAQKVGKTYLIDERELARYVVTHLRREKATP